MSILQKKQDKLTAVSFRFIIVCSINMETATECAVCAWRKDCKLKYSYEASGLHCKEFTKDVSLFPPETAAQRDKKKS